MAEPLDKATRILYRTLLKNAKAFDTYPAIKALICRDVGSPLPDPLDEHVAIFLGGEEKRFFWPTSPKSIVQAVQKAFRCSGNRHHLNNRESSPDDGFQALRYLNGILSIARKHGMLETSSHASEKIEGQTGPPTPGRILPLPEKGAILIAHPCLPSWFSRTVVLLCHHEEQEGTLGLCLNKPSDKPAAQLIAEVESQAATRPGGDSGQQAGTGDSLSALEEAREFTTTEDLEAQLMEILQCVASGDTAVLEIDDDETAKALANALAGTEGFLEGTILSEDESKTLGNLMNSDQDESQDGDGSCLVYDTHSVLERMAATHMFSVPIGGGHGGGPSSVEGGGVRQGEDSTDDDSDTHEELVSVKSTGMRTSSSSGSDQQQGDDGLQFEAINMRQVMEALPDGAVSFGGPVPCGTILHNWKDLGGEIIIAGNTEGGGGGGDNDAYLGLSASAAKVVHRLKTPDASNHLRLFLGDSRWAPKQLAAELQGGAWLLCRIDANTLDIFGKSYRAQTGCSSPDEVQVAAWERMLCAMGNRYAELAKVPVNAWEDVAQLTV